MEMLGTDSPPPSRISRHFGEADILREQVKDLPQLQPLPLISLALQTTRVSFLTLMKKMKFPNRLLLSALFLLSLSGTKAEEEIIDRPEWGTIFSRCMAEGTIVIEDERAESRGTFVFNGERAAKRFSPASTFKIPHALFALDEGIVRDEFQVFPWDGIERSYEAWNQDQTLRSSMRHSVVWVYETFAEALGEEREREHLKEIHYGNADPTGDRPFWVEGNLRISALEQIAFLRKLYRNQLPFDGNAQRLVKDVMINEAGRDWILRAKTGWSGTIGWWVGWVERPIGAVFFALNMDTPNKAEDLPKREAIVREVLQLINALPAK